MERINHDHPSILSDSMSQSSHVSDESKSSNKINETSGVVPSEKKTKGPHMSRFTNGGVDKLNQAPFKDQPSNDFIPDEVHRGVSDIDLHANDHNKHFHSEMLNKGHKFF